MIPDRPVEGGPPDPTPATARLLVHRIQRCCLHDGPGIRSTVFVQGCRLTCWWCHNPETRALASPQARAWEAAELLAELEHDQRFWLSSGGGITISGGEPLAQAPALAELLDRAGDHGHHRVVETAGAVGREAVASIGRRTDLWLWDLKTVDPERLRRHTGAEVDQVLGNLAWVLTATAVPVRVRVPLIAGVNDDDQELRRMAAWLQPYRSRCTVEILPGHDLSAAKRRRGTVAAPRRARPDAAALELARRCLQPDPT